MDESYYTDSMREFVAGLENGYEFKADISQMQDDEGPFLCIIFSETEVNRFRDDTDAYWAIANYLVNLRNGLMERGARVTFVVDR